MKKIINTVLVFYRVDAKDKMILLESTQVVEMREGNHLKPFNFKRVLSFVHIVAHQVAGVSSNAFAMLERTVL